MKKTYEYVGKKEIKAKIKLIKSDVPNSRGLGSSATCVVCGVMAANRLLNDILKKEDMLQIASYLEVSVRDIENAVNLSLTVKSMDYEIDDEKESNLYDYEAYNEKGYDEDILVLKDEIESLPIDEKRLIIARYFEDKSQMETSRELGMSQVQVSRKESKILQKIRNNITC